MSQSGSSARDSSDSAYRRQDSISSYYSEKDKVGRVTYYSSLHATVSKHNPNTPQDTSRDSQSDERRKLLASHESNHKPHHSKHHAPTVNVYTHCGRHTDQYLFGGWSNIFKKH
ncbi:hypothetical protein F4813DRAFT_211689 [Daldinia decipiens]|uniref:uncharacterized protein n=1 Tax=Daldinia decipiens TaxID=326647 RepID=UPI0020C4A3BB|nr:uncharacterized protein F4813DRAFT_211689 [Daldinia decipiens]KAI1654294.1 hypothetical protein F4813DRAFT_211689 [Daldinia decipiens]